MYGHERRSIKKVECWRIDAFGTVVLEKTLESPLDCKEIHPVHCKRNQSWTFFERTDGEAEAPKFWLPNGKSQLIGKDPDAGEDRGRGKKRVTEDEMVGWHHRLNGHEFKQTLGGSEGLGSLAYCSPWGHKELTMTERLNWTDWTENSPVKLSGLGLLLAK